MKILPAVLIFAALGSPASAQEKMYDVKVSASQLSLIFQGVGLLPWKDANPVMFTLNNQVTEQNKPPAPIPTPTPSPTPTPAPKE